MSAQQACAHADRLGLGNMSDAKSPFFRMSQASLLSHMVAQANDNDTQQVVGADGCKVQHLGA